MLPKNKTLELPKDYQGYCPALWKEVYVNTHGKTAPCCVWKDKDWFAEGPTSTNAVIGENLQNSDYFKKQRQTVLDNQIPKGCAYCVKQEEIGIKSQRKNLIDRLGPLDENMLKNTSVSNDDVEYLDIRPGNTCNYMCNFCGPYASHLIGKEWQRTDDKGETNFFNNEGAKYKSVKKQLIPSGSQIKLHFEDSFSKYKNLKFVHVAGGEPFFMENTFIQILDSIQNKENITFRVVTNVSLYNEDIMQRLSKFKKVRMQLSVDAVGRALEISRWKSDWENIQNNLKKYIEFRNNHKNVDMMFVPAVGVYTIHSLPDLLQFGAENKIFSDVLFIQDPVYQRVNLLPENELRVIKEKVVQKFLGDDISERSCNYKDIIQQFNHYIENNKVEENIIDQFWDWQGYFEKQRKYSLKEELPELYSSIKTV